MKKIVQNNFCILICIQSYFLTFCSEDLQKIRRGKKLRADIEKIKNDLQEAAEMIEETYERLQLLEIDVKDLKQTTDQTVNDIQNEKNLKK